MPEQLVLDPVINKKLGKMGWTMKRSPDHKAYYEHESSKKQWEFPTVFEEPKEEGEAPKKVTFSKEPSEKEELGTARAEANSSSEGAKGPTTNEE